MATNAPQDDWHKTGLRLPKELHHQLHEAAAASGRSYNAEIVARLEQSFTTNDGNELATALKRLIAGASGEHIKDVVFDISIDVKTKSGVTKSSKVRIQDPSEKP